MNPIATVFIILMLIIAMLYICDVDRLVILYVTPLSSYIGPYKLKPLLNTTRVVAVIECETLDILTLKSVLYQSVRVHDIAVQLPHPEELSQEILSIVSAHPPNSADIREVNNETIIIFIKNGTILNYDFIENEILKNKKI